MKQLRLKNIAFELFVIAFAIFEYLVLVKYLGQNYIYYIKPLMWGAIGIFAYFIISKRTAILDRTNKFLYVLVFIILFTTLYYILGLPLGFKYSAYSREFVKILRNIYCYALILIPYEVIRYSIISQSDQKSEYILAFITMVFVYLNISGFANSVKAGLPFTYLIGDVFPVLILQVFLNYLIKHCGLRCTLMWQMLPMVFSLILPIVPDLDWFYKFLYGVSAPLVCFTFVYYSFTSETLVKERKLNKTNKPYGGFAVMIVIFLLIGFVSGLFPISPTVIASDSMNPYFYKGDIVVINKNADYDVNSVIKFKQDGIYIVHRIVDVVEEGNTKYYITKGDNNNAIDSWKVYDNQIEGELCFIIPKIGYITIWVNQLFRS